MRPTLLQQRTTPFVDCTSIDQYPTPQAITTLLLSIIMFTFTPDGLFITIWYLSASVVVVLPLIVFGSTRLAHDRGIYNHADVYTPYKSGYGGYYYANGYQGNSYGQNAWHPTPCKWYQWGCSDSVAGWNYNGNQNVYGGNNPYATQNPWWYLWVADEQRIDQVIGVNPTLVVIYLWTLVMLGALVYHGHKTLVGGKNMNSVTASLFLFANFSFMSMLYLGGLTGAIEDDGEVLLIFGWYGQFGVLMYMTHLLCVIWGGIFFVIVRGMILFENNEKLGAANAEYVTYKECEIAAVADSDPEVI
jgi:hypothetical protein